MVLLLWFGSAGLEIRTKDCSRWNRS